MKKITKTVPCLSALCLVALVAAAPAAPQPVDEPERMTALAEQIEIMRLVLAKSINRGFTDLIAERRPPQDPTAAQEAEVLAQNYTAALRLLRVYGRAGHQKAQFTSHTRGFYAEGIGVVFSSEVQTPVSELEGEAAVKAAREPDEWSEAADEISGRAGGAFGRGTVYWDAVTTARSADTDDPVLWAIDPEFVEAAISSVLTMLAKHGLKIEALPEDEGIVVGLRLEPDVPLTSYSVGINEQAAELAYILMNRALHAGARRAAPMHLVIQISKRSLERFGAEDEVDVAALRREARITMYGGEPGAGRRGSTGGVQDAAVDETDDSRAWKEVRRLEFPPTATFAGTSFSLGGLVICPLEQDKLGVFLAYAVETVPEAEDLRVAFIDKDGKRHAAFFQGYGGGGPDGKGIRAHLFVTPESCPRAHVRKIIFDQFKTVSAEELPDLQKRERDLQKWEDDLQEREEQRFAEYVKDSPLGIPIVGKPYPFKLTGLNGNEVSTDKWKGKVIVMDFWATWCGPCVAETPKLKKLYEEYHDRGLEVVGISSDFKRAPLTEYVKDNAIRWPQVYVKDLGEKRQTALQKATGVTFIPRYFVIDRDGKLHTDRGRGRLEEIIPKLLAK